MRKSRVVYVLFFLSGASGLIYEVVWLRLFKEVFGVTAHAIAAVLATYLGGLALGSWALGRRADLRADALRTYGFLELGIGLTALFGALPIRLFDPIHVQAASRFAPDSAALAAVRLLLASIVILPPTVLMGGTFPAIARVFVGQLGHLGRQLSLLYALNTAGAVVGCMAAGFYLIGAIGTHPTLWLAAATNLALGAIALTVSRQKSDAAAAAEQAPHRAAEPSAFGLLFVAGLSGVASLALEVIWTRVLVLIVGSSTYAFVTMLSAFLVGIALGSFSTRLFVDRIRSPRRAFGWVQLGIAASTLATIPLLGTLVSFAQAWILRLDLHWVWLTLARFGISFLILLLPTIFIGMAFPLAAKIWVRGVNELGGELGKVYGANTVGNIVGALVGGFVLLPAVGIQRGIVLLTALNVACAAWGLFPSPERRGHLRSALRAAPVLATLSSCIGLLALWHPKPFVSVEERGTDRVLYYKEGLVSIAKVIQRGNDARQLVMLVDGVRIGQSNSGIDYKQQVLAHLPFLLKPDRGMSNVLSIGLGSGILIGEVAKHPGVMNVDCVELEPSVIEGARLFRTWNGDVLDNPAVHVIADDGVNFLRRSRAKYDAIISDAKSRLGQAGNALFYSRDYYARAREHLAPGGIMIQWMPLEEIPQDLRTIVRTFLMVFPHGYLWFGHESLFLVGMEQPLILDLPRIQRSLDAPETADLRRHGWRNAIDVAALLVADRESARNWLAPEDIVNSLEHPVLEFYSPRALATPPMARVAENVAALAATRRSMLHRLRVVGGDEQALAAHSSALGHLFEALTLVGRVGHAQGALDLFQKAVDQAPDATAIRHSIAATLVSMAVELEEAPSARLYRAAIAAWPENVTARLNLASALLTEGGTLEAVDQLTQALQLNPESQDAHLLLARILQPINPPKAIEHFREALRIAPQRADVHNDLARCLAIEGRADEALAEFGEAMRRQPDWAPPMAEAALLHATRPDAGARNTTEAIRLAKRASELTSFRNSGVLEILAASYAAAGRYREAVDTQRKALDLATASGDASLAAEAESALARYKSGIPIR